MEQVLKIILYIDSVLLIIAILSQTRGTGLSMTFGGNDNFYRKKRGPEKVLHNATIVFAVIFVLLALFIPFAEPLKGILGL